MRIRLTEWVRDWKAPEPQQAVPVILDLADEKHHFYLAVSLANGNFDEARFECDSGEAVECVVGLLVGAGAAARVAISPAVEACTLFESTYEAYVQGKDAYFFVERRPRPDLFEAAPPAPTPAVT